MAELIDGEALALKRGADGGGVPAIDRDLLHAVALAVVDNVFDDRRMIDDVAFRDSQQAFVAPAQIISSLKKLLLSKRAITVRAIPTSEHRDTMQVGPKKREMILPDADDMVAAINAHCRALSAHDKEAWLRLWSEDTVLEDPVGVDTYRGKDALATTFWGLIEELSPMKLWLERDVIVCGNEAIGLLQGVVSRNGQLTKVGWDPLESTCRHASLSIL